MLSAQNSEDMSEQHWNNLFMKQQFEKLKSVLGMPGGYVGTLRTPA